jgi:enamine deaminase RidA (YjgF/YER057c/UK114 family)
MTIQSIAPAGSEETYERFHFSQAVRSGNFVLCAGQLGTGSDGRIPEDPAEECANAWAAVGHVLAAAGLGFGDIVEYTSFHVGLAETLPAFMAARDAALDEPWPAWTAVGVTELALPGARVELKVTARIP